MNLGQKYQVYKNAISQMQGKVFYCEDDEGFLRRWTPPRVIEDEDRKMKDTTP